MNKTDVIIVACCFRLSPEDMLHRIRRLIGFRAKVIGYVVCANESIERVITPGWVLLPTDNQDFDFSAYLTGTERVRRSHPESSVVIFLNDTLFTDHAAAANFKALWRQVGLMKSLEIPAIAGKADPYTTVCLQNPWSGLGIYVTSFCFMLNQHAIKYMLQLRAMADSDCVTLEKSVDDQMWGDKLPPAFRQFIKANLVYKQSPYLWYRLKETNFEPQQLSSKARAIYFEHRLSGAISRNGCMVPTNAGPRWSTYLNFHERWSRVLRSFGF